jgi:phosphopantetheine--protein transferase-like protein
MSRRGGSVLGIGVDMTDVSRFRGLDRASGTVRHFLSAAEMDEIFSRDEPAQTLAGRFAAKEAVIKAASAAFPGRRVFYHDVVIGHNASGAPEARILGPDAGNYQILLSISHTKEHAIAFAMVVRNDDEHG